MFLSFIVPVYNTEQYLSECLDSLVDQDLPADAYEIICINDGSKDGSLGILREYEAKHPNIRVVDIENGGVSNARNIGIDMAQGDYLWMVDSDDFVVRNILSEIKRTIDETSPDILDFGAYFCSNKLSSSEKAAYDKNELIPTTYANRASITRSIFAHAFLDRYVLRFDPKLSYAEDNIFQCSCLLMNPNICLREKTYYVVRFWNGSTMTLNTQAALTRKISSLHMAVKKYYEFYQTCDQKFKSIIADEMVFNLCFLLQILSGLPKAEAQPNLETLKEDGLFPFHRPPECTLRRSYQTNRTDWIGRLYDTLWLNVHTYTGYQAMRIWNKAYAAYSKLRRR